MDRRIDGFEGNDEQYIRFLEAQVIALRRRQLRPSNEQDKDSNEPASRGSPAVEEQPFTGNRQPTPPASPISALQYGQVSNITEGEQSFCIVPWDPNQIPHPRKRRKVSNPPEWRERVEALTLATPRAKSWDEAIEKAGISEVMEKGNAAEFLLDRGYCVPLLRVPDNQNGANETLTEHLRFYAESACSRGTTASVILRLANFQQFLLLSTCAVLRVVKGMEAETLYEIIRIIIGDKSERYCERMMDTAVYMNRLLDTLSAHGWGHRAAELILLWNRPPCYYFQLSCSKDDSIALLRSKLTVDEFKMSDRPKMNESQTPLFIPPLVYQILRRDYPLDQISHILGYKMAHLLKIRANAWQLPHRRE